MMGLFNKNAEAYKLDLKDIVKKHTVLEVGNEWRIF
jgi:hypothetical protein